MRPPLTERQAQVLDYVAAHLRRHGRPPSLVEIGRALAIRSTNGVHRLVSALVAKGYLHRAPLEARGLTLAAHHQDLDGDPRIPVATSVSSREPASLRGRGGRELRADPVLLGAAGAADCVALVAGDDALASEGVLRGDLLVVERRAPADLLVGRLVAVLYGDVAVARRLETRPPRLVVSTSGAEPAADLIIPPDPDRLVVGHIQAVVRTLDRSPLR